MSDELSRFLDDAARAEAGQDDFVRVLRSSLRDEPSAASIARAATLLGLGSMAAMTVARAAESSLANTAAKGALESSVHAAQVTQAAPGVAAMAAKWLFCGVLAGAFGTMSLTRLSASHREAATETPRRAVASVVQTPSVQSPVAAPSLQAPVEAPSGQAPIAPAFIAQGIVERAPPEPAPLVRRGSRRENPSAALPPPAENAATPQAPLPTSLDAEIALLDDAHRALNAGDTRGALAALARAHHEIKNPKLEAETTLLKVQALVADGAHEEARELTRKTLATRGSDGYGCRLARIAGVAASGCEK